MATSRITLRKDFVDTGGECKIIIRVYIGDKQINISTPFKVTPRQEFFDLNSLLKKKYTNKHHEIRTPKQFNDELINYKAKVDLVVRSLLYEIDIEKINASLIKRALKEPIDRIVSGKTISVKDSFADKLFIEVFHEWASKIKVNNKYMSTTEYLKKFQKQKHKRFRIWEINKSFFDQFCYWFLDLKVDDEGNLYNHTTIRKHIDHLRWCMNYYLDDYGLSRSYKKFQFPYRTPENVLNPQALNQYEVELLYHFSFVGRHTSFKHMDEVRDLFLLSYAMGGQRISDLPKLVQADFREGYISFVQKKTNAFIENPISPLAEDLIKRNKFKFKLYSDQHINRILKECIAIIVDDPEFKKTAFKEFCFDRQVMYITYRGRTAKPVIEYKKLMDDFSFKYNRSTFISIHASQGWTREEIARFTGHKDLNTIDYYLKLYEDRLDDLSQKIQVNSLYWNLKKYQKPSDLKVKIESDGNYLDKRKINRELRSFVDKKDKEFPQIRTVSSREELIKNIKEDLGPIFKTNAYYEQKLKKK